MEADFSGYATKHDVQCSDGRTIKHGAFKGNDGGTVPLVWQHQHDSPDNILGYAKLEHRDSGVYAFAYFNDTAYAQTARELVQHGDVVSLSIYANQLKQRGDDVVHGSIKEVSLVLSGANPGAMIDFVSIKHGDTYTKVDDEAIIYNDEDSIAHEQPSEVISKVEEPDTELSHADPTLLEIVATMNEDQRMALEYLVGEALKDTSNTGDAKHGDDDTTALEHGSEEGSTMKHNVFDQNGAVAGAVAGAAAQHLSHDQLKAIMATAQEPNQTLKSAFLQHAVEYGIENLDLLFPDAKALTSAPELISRRMEWVNSVISGTRKSPFSRIKSLSADITHEEARARGYVKGSLKKEEFFAIAKRSTAPTTLYKKQKLDRDDIIDIVDLDVVAWLKAEMRLMLEEEIARAILIGDGREVDDEDKVLDPAGASSGPGIRSIAHDDDFYAHQVVVPANVTGQSFIEAVLRARPSYKGSGNPTLFITENLLTDLLLLKDKLDRRLYPTTAELTSQLRVSNIITLEQLDEVSTSQGTLLAILVNLSDYTVGTDKGGETTFFDDFDIDYNQYKYLYETRLSGALTKHKSALVISRVAGEEHTPVAPVLACGSLTVPASDEVAYMQVYGAGIPSEDVTGTTFGLDANVVVTIEAVAKPGYYIAPNATTTWWFTHTV